jgi:flagellar hook-length control protein FliK
MPPNVTNVIPEIMVVTPQKRTANTGEFESALSTAIDGQATPASKAEAPEKTHDTDPAETPATSPDPAIPEDVMAILMALLAQPAVVVPPPPVELNEAEQPQPTPEAKPEALPFAGGLLVTNAEQPLPKTPGEKDKKGDAEANKELPAQFKPATPKKQAAPLEASAINPAKALDLTRNMAEKGQTRPETTPAAASMLEVNSGKDQPKTQVKAAVPPVEINVQTVSSPAPASPTPPDILVEAATLSPAEQATQRVPEPVRTVAMSIGQLAAEQGQEVRMQLHPESLGRLDVKLNYEGSQVHVHLSAEVPQTGDMLQQYQGDLRVILAEAGVAVGQLTVSVGNGRAQQDRGFTPDGRQPAPSNNPVKVVPTVARKNDVKTSLVDYRV